MQPNISVIVPIYNTAKYLPTCLDSVLNQTLRNIEVICINDGSSDNSLDILKNYKQQDLRISIINKENEGVGAARNDGIKAAAGEYIAFMDSDDYYPSSNTLKTLYDKAKESSVEICGGYYQKVFDNMKVENACPSYHDLSFSCSGITSYKDFQYDYGYTSYIFSLKLLKDNNILFPTYGRYQDPPFFVKSMIAAEKFYALNEPTYCYRITQSQAKTTLAKTMDMLEGIKDNLEISKEQGLAKLHYITACRLNEEGSYMAIQNLYNEDREKLISRLIKLNALVDTAWLKNEGYSLPDPFVLKVFTHAIDTAEKYEKMRCGKLRKILTWLPRKLCK